MFAGGRGLLAGRQTLEEHAVHALLYGGFYECETVPYERVLQLSTVRRPWKLLHTPTFQVAVAQGTDGAYTAEVITRRLPRSGDERIVIMDVFRSVGADDNHMSGWHVNVLVRHKGIWTRFDPYYAHQVPDTMRMQACLDTCCARALGSSYRASETGAPFGPQMLTDSAPTKRRGEDYCLPLCLAYANAVSKVGGVEGAYDAMLRELGVTAPPTRARALRASRAYLEAMRRYTRAVA